MIKKIQYQEQKKCDDKILQFLFNLCLIFQNNLSDTYLCNKVKDGVG